MSETMESRVKVLAELRNQEKTLRSEVKWSEQILSEVPEAQALADVKDRLSAVKEKIALVDNDLRMNAISHYHEFGEKHPHPAIMIKMYSTLDYSDREALEYCYKNLLQALTLNRKVFEKVAMTIDLPIVEKSSVPRASIASDLSQWL